MLEEVTVLVCGVSQLAVVNVGVSVSREFYVVSSRVMEKVTTAVG